MTRRLTFSGIVQGIGFRPTALRIAQELGIKGQVKNTGGNAEIIICADKQALDEFVRRLVSIFEIRSFTEEEIEERLFNDFSIVHSTKDNKTPFITPDLATCKACEKELREKSNRRYNHPFISCVDCGPRYTIINTLPYDRENTAMSEFDMCRSCEQEYKTASDRRCHAQTIACRDCGPEISMSIDEAADILKSGNILAIKDIGGYHLACDVNAIDSVKKIRKLKGREAKPFAIMFSSIDEIRQYCKVSKTEEKLITSPARPIVLLEKTRDFDNSVSSGSEYTGAFLPCNPIQIMLLERISPLVMTSANISSEPIIINDDEIKKFGVPILSHNRKILTPLDDSVVKVVSGRTQIIRRARGYTPLAVEIENTAKADTLCLGGDLKSVFAFHRDNYVFLSQHFGDLESKSVQDTYKYNIKRFKALHGFEAELTVADKHPAYFSSAIYDNDVYVQHHKAHIASVIAEHKLSGDVLGFAFDGTGYGDDGAIWGSEIILYQNRKFVRKEHLEYTKMLASDELSRNSDLALACYTGGNELVDKAIENDINTVLSSSMGRLFDAVSALLDIRHYNSYEGECACALEAVAKGANDEYIITPSLKPKEILEQIKLADAPAASIALGFHMMLVRLICDLSVKYRKLCGVKQIALSGGVFNNAIITENAINELIKLGFEVYINEAVPCGDGGLALGQAFIASLEE